MNKIDLNIFSNCTTNFSDSAELINQTYKSFVNCFSLDFIGEVRVFVDPHPKYSALEKYVNEIHKVIPNQGIHVTDGLTDGFIKSTEICNSDYIFQLEHDWLFTKEVNHSLGNIINFMQGVDAEHFRFNKRPNIIAGADATLVEINHNGFKACKTNIRSNNPHIINRKSYIDKCNHILTRNDPRGRQFGVEDNLDDAGGGYIYGPLNHPAQIIHTDGSR